MILIVGATGVLGRATARKLLNQGHAVRALVRDRARAEDLRKAGAEIVVGDLTDPPSLSRACKGMQRVFACAHSMLGRGAQSSAQVDHVGHSALVVAAREANVEHFVYTSMLGAREDHPIDFVRTKFEIEGVVRDSGMGFTILRPSAFMEHHVHRFIGQMLLDKGFVVLIGPATKPRNFVAVRDVAPFAVVALTEDGLNGRTVEIGGPDNVSNSEIAHMYAVRARKGRIFHLPQPVARAAAAAIRPLHEGVARVLDISMLDERQMRETWQPSKLLAEFPLRLTSVDAFIDERVAEWRRRRGTARRT
ncbi:MAG: SDR family oxidoreductase [Aquincola sp.]|nr:SDR family oxidoreductase [Aquincola sp.]MDH5329851.1 SDR family oxidoreductase [Aquincola sp.]